MARHTMSKRHRLNPLLFDLLMTFVAGFLDAVGVTFLSGIYVSFMSGNSVSAGLAIQSGNVAAAAPIFCMIGGFVVGAFLGTILFERPTVVALVIFSEVALIFLSIFAVGRMIDYLALLPVSMAMGMQNAIPRSISGVSIGRTFITGALFGLGQSLARALSDRSRLRDAALHGASWVVLLIGAAIGALSLARLGLITCLGASIVVLSGVTLIDSFLRFRARRGSV